MKKKLLLRLSPFFVCSCFLGLASIQPNQSSNQHVKRGEAKLQLVINKIALSNIEFTKTLFVHENTDLLLG